MLDKEELRVGFVKWKGGWVELGKGASLEDRYKCLDCAYNVPYIPIWLPSAGHWRFLPHFGSWRVKHGKQHRRSSASYGLAQCYSPLLAKHSSGTIFLQHVGSL
jgi:hypothetical protein